MLFRHMPFGLVLAYIPKGPVGSLASSREARGVSSTSFWEEIDRLCRDRRAAFLKVEPDEWAATQDEAPPPGFRPGLQQIQPRRTLLVDISGDEAAILGRMKQKTRYNIRLAQKKGVLVNATGDLNTFHQLMQATGQRDAFGVHSLEYYRLAYDLFHSRGECEHFVATLDGEALGGLMVFARARAPGIFTALHPTCGAKLCQPTCFSGRRCAGRRGRGCTSYDLWGVPDADEQTLEAQFTQRSDGLWGVYRFKRGFGGQLCTARGPWDRVYRPVGYQIYRLGLRLRSVEAG